LGPDLQSIIVTVITFTAAGFAICSVGLYIGVLLGRGLVSFLKVVGRALP
jgi:hypothetical protein